jgi:hypothetical protein
MPAKRLFIQTVLSRRGKELLRMIIKIRTKLRYRLDVSPLAKLAHTHHSKESVLNRSVMWYILYITNLKVMGF